MTVEPQKIERALSVGEAPDVGAYRYNLQTGQWWWADEVYQFHGFAPREVTPTTEMILRHKHPEDRERVQHVLDEARSTGAPFSSVHRILDASGRTRTLAVVGQGRRDGARGEVVELMGYFVDLSAAIERVASARAAQSIQESAEHRGAIEQAKGVLTVTLGTSPEESFEALRRHSNLTNVPVRALSTWLVSHAQGLAGSPDAADLLHAFLRDPHPVDGSAVAPVIPGTPAPSAVPGAPAPAVEAAAAQAVEAAAAPAAPAV